MTALTFTETLSREITSWVGTSRTMVRRSTRTSLLDKGDQDDQSRPLHAREAAKREHHRALILAHDLDRRGNKPEQRRG